MSTAENVEIVDHFDSENNILGKVDRVTAYADKLNIHIVQVMLVDPSGKFVLQLRHQDDGTSAWSPSL
jgi:hypothetical protein